MSNAAITRNIENGVFQRAEELVEIAKKYGEIELSLEAAGIALLMLFADASYLGFNKDRLDAARRNISIHLKQVIRSGGMENMARGFDRSAVRVPGAPNMPGYSIKCSKCGSQDKISCNNRSGSMPPEGVTARFRSKGWYVSNKEGHDICPSCIEKQKKTSVKKESNVVALKPEIIVEPPREMKREDRRLIFAKIEDVYLDEAQGYSSGWSDKKVSADLGVPLAWVRSIREENFGSEGHNEDVKAIIEEGKDLLSKIDVEMGLFEKAISDAGKRKEDFLKRYDHLARRLNEIEKLFG